VHGWYVTFGGWLAFRTADGPDVVRAGGATGPVHPVSTAMATADSATMPDAFLTPCKTPI